MRVEVLVSTMNQTDHSLIEKMRISTDAVVVNQCQEDSVTEFDYNGSRIKWINSTTRGLSISRNICLSEARGEICLIADDDLEYVEGYEDIVRKAFANNKKASIIRFKVCGIEKTFKNYPKKAEKVGLLKSMKISSVEVAMLRDKVAGLKFDEYIGAGKKFCMGEENAFLVHCLKNGLKLYFSPQVISNLHITNSSWKDISAERYFISRGAAFEAMDLKIVHLLILQFAIRKWNMFDRSLTIRKRIQLMEDGRKEYITERGKRNGRFYF